MSQNGGIFKNVKGGELFGAVRPWNISKLPMPFSMRPKTEENLIQKEKEKTPEEIKEESSTELRRQWKTKDDLLTYVNYLTFFFEYNGKELNALQKYENLDDLINEMTDTPEYNYIVNYNVRFVENLIKDIRTLEKGYSLSKLLIEEIYPKKSKDEAFRHHKELFNEFNSSEFYHKDEYSQPLQFNQKTKEKDDVFLVKFQKYHSFFEKGVKICKTLNPSKDASEKIIKAFSKASLALKEQIKKQNISDNVETHSFQIEKVIEKRELSIYWLNTHFKDMIKHMRHIIWDMLDVIKKPANKIEKRKFFKVQEAVIDGIQVLTKYVILYAKRILPIINSVYLQQRSAIRELVEVIFGTEKNYYFKFSLNQVQDVILLSEAVDKIQDEIIFTDYRSHEKTLQRINQAKKENYDNDDDDEAKIENHDNDSSIDSDFF